MDKIIYFMLNTSGQELKMCKRSVSLKKIRETIKNAMKETLVAFCKDDEDNALDIVSKIVYEMFGGKKQSK